MKSCNTRSLLHGCGGKLSEYGNPAIWLVHEGSDISRVARSGKGNFKKPCLCPIEIKIFDNIWSENALRTTKKGKVTMYCEVSEKILYEMTTEFQVFIRRFVPLHLHSIILQWSHVIKYLFTSIVRSTSGILDFCFCTDLDSLRSSWSAPKNIGPIFH